VVGALSGVELQTLAFETLRLGRDVERAWTVVPYLLALLAAFAAPWFRRASWWTGLGLTIAASAGLFVLSVGVQAVVPLSADVTPPVIALWLAYGWGLLARLEVLAEELYKRTMEVRDRNAMLSAVLRENADGVLILDDRLRVKLINPAACRLLHTSEKTAIGRPGRDVLPLPDLEEMFQLDLLDDTGSRSFETQLPRKGVDDEPMPIEITVGSGAFSPGIGRFERRREVRHVHFVVFRDITERRQAQEALILAAEKASEADRAKSEFIANVSHELRTPLNAIIGFSEILRKQMFGELGAPQYIEYAEDINLSGQHLLDLINDVLLVSKIESGGHDLKERKLDVAMVAEASLRIVRGYPKAASLNFVTDIPEKLPSLNADERAFRQILLNVLSNAVKFTPAGGRVHLGIRVESLGDLAITVTDTGIGIPAEKVSQVTSPFFQVDGAMHRQFAGTGLGLNIVAKLAALHGAKLEIESREGVGTAVSVRFPPARVISSENVVRLDLAAKDRRKQS
jgi:signal transduction histidine kinase